MSSLMLKLYAWTKIKPLFTFQENGDGTQGTADPKKLNAQVRW